MAIPAFPWRHRYSASAAAPGRFIETERLSPTAHQHGTNQEFLQWKKGMKKYQSFLHTFFASGKMTAQKHGSNPCQTVLRASQNQASTLSIQESPAAALNLSSGNAGSCCKGWYPCFYLIVLLFTNLQNSFRFSRENRGGKSGACTGIHGVLSAKAAFRPEYSRYTWQMGQRILPWSFRISFSIHLYCISTPFSQPSLKILLWCADSTIRILSFPGKHWGTLK